MKDINIGKLILTRKKGVAVQYALPYRNEEKIGGVGGVVETWAGFRMTKMWLRQLHAPTAMVGKDESSFLTPSFPGSKETGFYAQYENEYWTKAAKVAYTHSEARCFFNQMEGRLLINLMVVIDGDKQERIGATKIVHSNSRQGEDWVQAQLFCQQTPGLWWLPFWKHRIVNISQLNKLRDPYSATYVM